MADLFHQYEPKAIGLGIGGSRGMTRSLTYESYRFLSEAMGEEGTARFVSAENLIEEYLDTRIPEEFEHYQINVHLTEVLVRRAFSAEVITPGETTTEFRIEDHRLEFYGLCPPCRAEHRPLRT